MSDNYRLNYSGLITYDNDIKEYFQNNLPTVMNGATKFHDGSSGLVPSPIVGDQNKFLKGDGLWSDIPSFISLYDTNKEPIIIGQNEIEISFIECNLNKKVDLEGHFTVSFLSSEDCNVYIRIKCDDITEIYTPQVFEVQKGFYSIGIPHAYIGKNIGIHNFTISIQCSNGQITIPTRSLLYTIYGSIDDSYKNELIDIIDFSIKDTIADESPSEIWALGFETSDDISELMLRKNNYNNPNGNRWTDVYNFGNSKSGALEFYGIWNISSDNNSKYDLITDEYPFVFIIDNNDNLIVYSNDDYENGTTLATNISKVSACIGYKSIINPELDQGLLIAYIKNGNVYYRQWKYYDYETNDWFPSEELYMNGDAIDVQVHRLPDYRMGILIKYSGGSKWFITDRTFIGNTYKNEYIKNNIDGDAVINIVPSYRMGENLGVATINNFPEQHYHNGFIMEFEGDLQFLKNKTIENLRSNITASRAGTSKSIRSVEIDGNKLIIYTTDDIQGGSTFTISWTMNELITTNMNGCKMLITQKSYTWNLPTTNIHFNFEDDNIENNINGNLNATIRPIININQHIIDSTNTSIDSSLNCVVGQISYETSGFEDNIGTSINSTFNTVVSLVGETPI